MATYLCQSCEARNTRGGRCTMCEVPLGSLLEASFVASMTATLFALVWIVISWLTGLEFGALALLFGGCVSGAVAMRQGGRGFAYQAVASFFTIVGLALADAVVVRMHWFKLFPDWPPNDPLPPMLDLLAQQAQWDGMFLVFVLLGFAGGLFLWK